MESFWANNITRAKIKNNQSGSMHKRSWMQGEKLENYYNFSSGKTAIKYKKNICEVYVS